MAPINVGSANDVSILERAQTVAKTLNPQTQIPVGQTGVPGADPLRHVPSLGRARELLGVRWDCKNLFAPRLNG